MRATKSEPRRGIDYAAIAAAGGLGKGVSTCEAGRGRRLSRDAALRRAYRLVDRRDDSICCVTRVPLEADHDDLRRRREHHHLVGRWVRPAWRHDPDRIITVSAFVHALIGAKQLLVQGLDAAAVTFAWNRDRVPAGTEPFSLTNSCEEAA